jgi:hypothetical protein
MYVQLNQVFFLSIFMHIVDVWLNPTTCLKCKTSFVIGFYES